jgi:hypothetical protein
MTAITISTDASFPDVMSDHDPSAEPVDKAKDHREFADIYRIPRAKTVKCDKHLVPYVPLFIDASSHLLSRASHHFSVAC